MAAANVTLTVPTAQGYSLGKVVTIDGAQYTVVSGTVTVPNNVSGPLIAAGWKPT